VIKTNTWLRKLNSADYLSTATIPDKYRHHTLPETEGIFEKVLNEKPCRTDSYLQCKKPNKTLTGIIKTSTKKQGHKYRHINPGKKHTERIRKEIILQPSISTDKNLKSLYIY